ncbi:peptidoglycan-associated lipoprotein Pal [Marinobacter sp. X15-166B]|uniref:peptidoglycan-associated lipoprotein Pal n=1 Tax=Marinobacter sp. X15-166B TaxID=1897620 RepID=UPI00085CC45F|nr:peptidoglycan-associated lipoprotein Pal [Marinobacter sp. X15-166B]OEY67251.1 peptidoglycan-associated lipoprotein [Marinobacter sp. X15-166B]
MKFSVQQKAFAIVLSLGLMAGCSSTGDIDGEEGYGTGASAVDQSGGSTVYGGAGEDGISSTGLTDAEAQQLAEQAELEALRNVTVFYFDFDTSEIKQDVRDVLIAHAQFLAANPGQRVRLEGHADERGSKEYNLALGERRANSVQRFLIVNGASRNQLETVSYGEEKPQAMGSSESDHAQNRRVELVFQ